MELVRGLHNFSQRHARLRAYRGQLRWCASGPPADDRRAQSARRRNSVPPPRYWYLSPVPRNSSIPDGAPPRLTRWREKFLALEALGVDRLVTLRFDEDMRAMTPDALRRGTDRRRAWVRATWWWATIFATAAMPAAPSTVCARPARAHGFGVEQVAPFVLDGVRVSSTAVRERLERGDFAGADAFVRPPLSDDAAGWFTATPWDARLGFPTANLRLMRRKSPVARHVWRCACAVSSSGALPGVASLGTRPTVDGRRCCSKCMCSILTAICMAARSRLNSSPSCAMKRSSNRWTRCLCRCRSMRLLAREILIQGEPWLITNKRSICRTRVFR